MSISNTKIYEVTATKRRPKTFDELAGQEFVVSTIKNSLESGKIAPAYLFSGPRGCGKTSAARILARSLNCEKTTQAAYKGNPCGVCDNCKAISQSSSVDVIEIDGASNTSINDVKKIQEEILFPPQTGPYKVYIIDEVHMLSNSAFNALLKTIEEPPPYIVFIFATTELHKVPATIKSRCQQFNFRLIPIETIQEILKKVCDETGVKAEEEALFWIARESTGSMRDAYTLFDQIISFSEGNIREKVIREKLGLVGLENLNALAEACAVNDASKAFALVDDIISSGVAIEQCIIDMAGYYRGLLLLKNGITRESLLGYRANLFSAEVQARYDSIRLGQALELLLDCYRNVRYSISPRFELETAVSKLAWLSHWVSPTELSTALNSAKAVLTKQPGYQAFIDEKKSSIGQQPGTGGAAGKNPGKPDPAANAFLNTSGRFDGKQAPSLADNFKRVIAARTGSDAAGAGSGSGAGNSGGSGSGAGSGVEPDNADNDDVPVWSSRRNESGSKESPVEKVLRIIPGTEVLPENN